MLPVRFSKERGGIPPQNEIINQNLLFWDKCPKEQCFEALSWVFLLFSDETDHFFPRKLRKHELSLPLCRDIFVSSWWLFPCLGAGRRHWDVPGAITHLGPASALPSFPSHASQGSSCGSWPDKEFSIQGVGKFDCPWSH